MGNIFGKNIKIMTFGESHGPAVGVVIDGVKPGLKITQQDIQKELNRRRPGQSKVVTPRAEQDKVHILSGIFNNKTTGSPICLVIYNKDVDSSKYEKLKHVFRPGHADFTFFKKYGIRDYRGGGRQSARETVGRVASGAIAKKILEKKNIEVIAYTLQVGNIRAKKIDYKQIEKNPVRCPDMTIAKKMEKKILQIKAQGDSIGGIIEVVVKNCPVGLGDPVFDKLDANLANAIISIPAIKGIEFGVGFQAAQLKGSENNDPFYYDKKTKRTRTRTNNAGGIAGGISNGEDIIFRTVIKPPSSIPKQQITVDKKGKKKKIKVTGRHDPCLCPRAVPVIEHMTNLVIADALLSQQKLKK